MAPRSEKAVWDDLDRLLSESTPWSRMTWRNSIRSRSRRGRDVWGFERNPYKAFFAGMVILAIAVPIVVSFSYRNDSHPAAFLGIWAYVGWIAIILIPLATSPLVASMMRKCEIRRRRALDSALFLSRLREAAPGIPDDFALASREALASSYNIPVGFMDTTDTRRRTMALSRLTSPLALEIIADIDRKLGLDFSRERLLDTSSAFAKNRPSNIAELIRLLYETICMSAK